MSCAENSHLHSYRTHAGFVLPGENGTEEGQMPTSTALSTGHLGYERRVLRCTTRYESFGVGNTHLGSKKHWLHLVDTLWAQHGLVSEKVCRFAT